MVAKRIQHHHEEDTVIGEEIAPNAYLLSPEEAWILFNNHVQDYLGMSGQEFINRLKTNDFTEEQREYVWILRMMVPFGYSK